ncbi:MAG: tRNA pseudouridine(38-40) synthase TruA [Methanolinea sp.]|nr:tRNA pseudouridine(38-40) synthase TruA [Methanolinea sp.]
MEEDLAQDLPEVRRLAFRCGYIGDGFFGSQVQAGPRTVEGEFFAACLRLGLFSDARSGRFQAAGRTDRGVHARGQVFCISTPFPGRAVSLLRWHLPSDLWVTGYAEVPPDFHPRHAAHHRTYRYFFGDRDLDVPAMDRAARIFLGTHDFSQFARRDGRDPVRRVLSARVFAEGGLPVFEVCAESFLWHMVRYMAQALSLVGSGRGDEGEIASRLEGASVGPLSPAAPGGLVLWEIAYGFSFIPVDPGHRARRFLSRELASHRVMARVIGHLAGDGPDQGSVRS